MSRPHASLLLGGALVSAMVLAATLSLVWTPYPPGDIDVQARFSAPSALHWLGTDSLGHDLFSQLLAGAQNSLAAGLLAVALGLGVGVAMGCLAAARGGWLDALLMRVADIGFAFPALVTALLLTALAGPGLLTSTLAIGLFNIPVFARVTRSAARSVWTRDFVLAARMSGKNAWQITRDHVLPNIAALLIVQATIQFATAILAEAALSYLGLGTQPPQPSWGRMLAEAQAQLMQAPQLALYPGLAIAWTVLGLNLLGDGLRDRLDPRLARRR
jgi:peptide/nickel transport system permease protein